MARLFAYWETNSNNRNGFAFAKRYKISTDRLLNVFNYTYCKRSKISNHPGWNHDVPDDVNNLAIKLGNRLLPSTFFVYQATDKLQVREWYQSVFCALHGLSSNIEWKQKYTQQPRYKACIVLVSFWYSQTAPNLLHANICSILLVNWLCIAGIETWCTRCTTYSATLAWLIFLSRFAVHFTANAVQLSSQCNGPLDNCLCHNFGRCWKCLIKILKELYRTIFQQQVT